MGSGDRLEQVRSDRQNVRSSRRELWSPSAPPGGDWSGLGVHDNVCDVGQPLAQGFLELAGGLVRVRKRGG